MLITFFFLTISVAFAVECEALLPSMTEVLGLNLVPKGYLTVIFSVVFLSPARPMP